MLPIIARDILKADLKDAETMAAEGNPHAGYQTLVAGRARAVATRNTGKFHWAEEMVRRYDETMEEYVERYHLTI